MGEMERTNKSFGFLTSNDSGITSDQKKESGITKVFDPAFSSSFFQLPHKLQNYVKSQFNRLAKENEGIISVNSFLGKDKGSSTAFGIDPEKQLQAWRENPSWVDQPPELKVTVPKGSLCNLNVKVDIGLPPDAIYDIITDPDNKRVFKNIKEVISREVLIDEGRRQVVEVEQAAAWRFLWWSGVFSVHVLVDQNREDHSMKFKQVKTGFMKKFEGCWRLEPIFVDENICFPFKPKSWADYTSCTGGKGRVGSKVTLEQLIQPALVPPPPISWYVRGITAKTTETMITDLIAEAARIREGFPIISLEEGTQSTGINEEPQVDQVRDIKERWSIRRRNAKHYRRKLLTAW
ncbi:hypothetical protein SLA2020_238450 [Shorea laevis]